jgi:hypothetical protein
MGKENNLWMDFSKNLLREPVRTKSAYISNFFSGFLNMIDFIVFCPDNSTVFRNFITL